MKPSIPKHFALTGLIILLSVGLFLVFRRSEPESTPRKELSRELPSQTQAVAPVASETQQEVTPEHDASEDFNPSQNQTREWWREPIYSSYQYDPDLADDPDYRKLVTHHLYLDASYKSPVRQEACFQELLGIMEAWKIDPEQEIELLVQANNMAFQYHAIQRFHHKSTGIAATESMRESEERHRNFMGNNMKETFAFLFDDTKGRSSTNSFRSAPPPISSPTR